MHEQAFDDDILFDRLVDGELDSAERRRLLESLDARTDGWRRCALAFLEAQTWREGLGQLVAKPQAITGTADTSAPLVTPSARTGWRSSVQWLALAASLALAFGLGWMQRNDGSNIANVAPATSEGLVSVQPTAPKATSPSGAKAGDALNLWVRDDGGQMRRVRVPLVDAGTLDEQMGLEFQTGMPDALRKRLQDRGLTVQSKRKYAPLWLENGRPMVVPVEDTTIVPVSNKVY